MSSSVARLSSTFGIAVAVSNVAQLVWVAAGARALGVREFGIVLACQALYGVMQVITDNGSGIHGARQAAKGALTREERAELVTGRILLAGACAITGLLGVGVLAPYMFIPLLPFAVALVTFAVLNVWEPYGRGHAGAYATYLVLRSSVLAIVVVVCLESGLAFFLWVAGLCEIAAILITGSLFRAWTPPRPWTPPGAATWRAIRDVGGPSLITQGTFAAGTIILGVVGNPSAAAVAGVGTRLLTGLQGVNGVLAAGLFPRIASGDSRADGRAARLVPVGIVGLSFLALSVSCLLQSSLLRVVLDHESSHASDALILYIGSAAASGYVLHLTFAVLAQRAESGLVGVMLTGAVLTVLAAVVGSASPPDTAALIAAAGFLAGQALVLGLVVRHVRRRWLQQWISLPLAALAGSGCAVAVLATAAPIAAAVVSLGGVAWCVRTGRTLIRQARPASTSTTMEDVQ